MGTVRSVHHTRVERGMSVGGGVDPKTAISEANDAKPHSQTSSQAHRRTQTHKQADRQTHADGLTHVVSTTAPSARSLYTASVHPAMRVPAGPVGFVE